MQRFFWKIKSFQRKTDRTVTIASRWEIHKICNYWFSAALALSYSYFGHLSILRNVLKDNSFSSNLTLLVDDDFWPSTDRNISNNTTAVELFMLTKLTKPMKTLRKACSQDDE